MARVGQLDARVVGERRGQVERGHGLRHHLAGRNAGTAREQSHPQQAFVGHRTLQDQAVVAEPVAVVGRVHDERVLRETQLIERGQDAANVVVDQRDHAVVVGDQLAQLLVILDRRARRFLAEGAQFRIRHLRRAVEAFLVPPRPPLKVHGAMLGQIHVVGMMQPAPGIGTVEGMMRIWKRRPGAEALVAMRAQVFDGLVADPGRVVPGHRQRRMVGLRRVRHRRQLRHEQAVFLLAAAVGVIPALVVLPVGRLERRPGVVPFDHQFDVLETHVGPVPVPRLRRGAAFRRAGRREVVRRLEVRLADVAGAVARFRERAREAGLAGRIRQIDAVIRDAVRRRQQAGEDRRARWLAHHVRRDAGGEARAFARQHVEVRRPDPAAFEAVAIRALLVRGDEEDVQVPVLP